MTAQPEPLCAWQNYCGREEHLHPVTLTTEHVFVKTAPPPPDRIAELAEALKSVKQCENELIDRMTQYPPHKWDDRIAELEQHFAAMFRVVDETTTALLKRIAALESKDYAQSEINGVWSKDMGQIENRIAALESKAAPASVAAAEDPFERIKPTSEMMNTRVGSEKRDDGPGERCAFIVGEEPSDVCNKPKDHSFHLADQKQRRYWHAFVPPAPVRPGEIGVPYNVPPAPEPPAPTTSVKDLYKKTLYVDPRSEIASPVAEPPAPTTPEGCGFDGHAFAQTSPLAPSLPEPRRFWICPDCLVTYWHDPPRDPSFPCRCGKAFLVIDYAAVKDKLAQAEKDGEKDRATVERVERLKSDHRFLGTDYGTKAFVLMDDLRRALAAPASANAKETK